MYSLGPKPSLIREPPGSTRGASIEVEVWELPIDKVGCVLLCVCVCVFLFVEACLCRRCRASRVSSRRRRVDAIVLHTPLGRDAAVDGVGRGVEHDALAERAASCCCVVLPVVLSAKGHARELSRAQRHARHLRDERAPRRRDRRAAEALGSEMHLGSMRGARWQRPRASVVGGRRCRDAVDAGSNSSERERVVCWSAQAQRQFVTMQIAVRLCVCVAIVRRERAVLRQRGFGAACRSVFGVRVDAAHRIKRSRS